MFCCLSPPFRISMSSDFPHYSFRMPNIGFQNLPLNIYIVVFGTAIFVFILSLLFCCYLIRYDQCILQIWSCYILLYNILAFIIYFAFPLMAYGTRVSYVFFCLKNVSFRKNISAMLCIHSVSHVGTA